MESTAPEGVAEGQAAEGLPGVETTQSAPEATQGQAASATVDAGTTVATPADSGNISAQQQQSFFDPADIPEGLQDAYKSMQASYTKKMQALSADRQKIEAHDRFMSDPMGQLKQVAERYGYQFVPVGQQQAQQQQAPNGQDWEPQTWNEVIQRAKEEAKREVMQEFSPVMQDFQKMKASTIEKEFDALDPQWRDYEDAMRENMRKHPTLASDPAMLYRLSVPDDVVNSRATQRALKQLEKRTQGAQVGTKSTVAKSSATGKSISSFQDAVDAAKRMIAERG